MAFKPEIFSMRQFCSEIVLPSYEIHKATTCVEIYLERSVLLALHTTNHNVYLWTGLGL